MGTQHTSYYRLGPDNLLGYIHIGNAGRLPPFQTSFPREDMIS